MRILVTGGAGFVGSRMALLFRDRYPKAEIVAFDNLRRRGSELNLATFKKHNIGFVHGDVRQSADLDSLAGSFDLMLEASAEPSVLAGMDGSPEYLLQTNLLGTMQCLEFLRKRGGKMIFLSTSRVYSIKALQEISLTEAPTRFENTTDGHTAGLSTEGISERFSTQTARSLYGASKLASEMLIQEYAEAFGLDAIVNRCGVLCGPGQFGKTDQGVFTLWMAAHAYGMPLNYFGFGGQGKQVRDLLHPEDLFELLVKQWDALKAHSGEVFNVGGGNKVSTSLQEWTRTAQRLSGKETPIGSKAETASVDVAYYVSDCRKVANAFGWNAQKSTDTIAQEILDWLEREQAALRPLFGAV